MEPRNRPRLLCVGDGGVATGFARVTESVLSRLCDRYEVHHLAANYRGDPHELPWRLYPAATGGDPFGVGRLPEILRRVKPRVIWTVNDAWIQSQYLDQIRKAETGAAVFAYTAIDAGPIDPEWLQGADRAKAFVVYTEFARREVLRAGGDRMQPLVRVIPHGVCRETFFPIAELTQAEAKQRLGIIDSADEPSFVVLNANRNQERKRIDLTLLGFAEFARDKPPWVKLLLHMGQSDLGWNLIKLSRRLGIEERLILSGPPDGSMPSASSQDLNLIYNASDVGLNTSGAEGWGLTALEHAAAGRAQVVPKHSACEEIWEGAALLLDAPDCAIQSRTLGEFCFTRPDFVASALQRLFEDPDLRAVVARRCFEVALRPALAWDTIAESWSRLFESAL